MKAILMALALVTGLPADVRLPAFSREVLPNGTVLLTLPRSDVPLVTLQLHVRGGTESDSPAKAGLAAVTAEALRRGTTKHSAEEFSRELDFLGAEFSAYVDRQSTIVALECLAKDFEKGLGLLTSAAVTPSFPQEEVKKLLAQRIDAAKALKDNPGAAARTYFLSFFFPAGHPYGAVADETTLTRISREDVLAHHKAFYNGKNFILVVAGDIDPEKVKAAVKGALGTVPAGQAYRPASAPTSELTKSEIAIVDKSDATQTEILLGLPGIGRTHPDRTALWLVNTAFGGRFTSILNDELRVNSGLTYGARSSFDRDRLPGRITISTFTATETTGKTVDTAMALLKKLGESGITADQLSSVKAYVKGTYPSEQLETADQLAGVLAEIELFGLNRGEVDDLFSRIDAVTLEKANEVARRYFGASRFRMLLLGNAAKFKQDVLKYDAEPAQVSITQPGLRVAQ